MYHALKLRPLGTSTGVIIPRDILARLNVKKGDSLHLIENSDGYRLVADDPEAVAVRESYQRINERHRKVFRELAK